MRAGDYDYILAFPTAGGHMQEDHLDGVLFDHLMLEVSKKARSNYSGDLTTFAEFCRFEVGSASWYGQWIWIHMAINAGVTSDSYVQENLENPKGWLELDE